MLITLFLFHFSLEFCKEPPDMGRGTTFAFSVYYDPQIDKCNPFFYQGEGGNANRFSSERECLRNCSPNAESFYPREGKCYTCFSFFFKKYIWSRVN